MGKTEKPEGFKFEDNRFKIVIDAKGKDDGETISSKLEANVRCDEKFALHVIDNAFEKDPQLYSLFRRAVAMRALDELMEGRLKMKLEGQEEDI
jgi:hypothetical protein